MSRFLASAAVVAMVIAAPAAAQDAEGYWAGTLDLGGTQLGIGVSIERGEDGTLSGTADSPDQGVFDLPLADIVAEDGTLSFTIPRVSGGYTGVWDPAQNIWDGTFNQGGMRTALTLSAAEPPERTAAPRRPSLPENWSVPSDDAIAGVIADRIAQRPGTGMVVAVIEDEETRAVSGGGDAFDADTVFEIGSITKVFVAMLLADMTLDGTVSLDDPISAYLPDGAQVPTRNGEQITLKNLARHDSGLPRLPTNFAPSDIANPYGEFGEAELLGFLGGYELERDIGSEYDYSNLGFGLLGYLLERAGGADLETLLRQRILDPLEMNDTGIALSSDQRTRFVTGRDEYNRETSAWDFDTLAGAGALRSTTNDMLKFAAAAMDPNSPIAPAMQLALSDLREAPGFRTGLGWMVLPASSGLIAMHGGGTGGFRTHVAVQEDTGRGVVVMTNSAIEPSAQDVALHMLIGAPLAEAGPVPEVPTEVAREEIALTTAQLDRFVGTYRVAPGLDMTITREDDQLLAAITGQGPLPIFPRSEREFFYRAVNAEIVFADEDGEITGATFTQDGMVSPMTKVE